MKTPTKLFTAEQITAIETAIRQAEETTSAEIVPVVAKVSGRYDRAEDLFAFLFSLVSLGCTWVLLQDAIPATETWGGKPTSVMSLPIVLAILVATFFAGIALASRFPALRLPLIAKREMQEEVERRAHETFKRLKIRNTENATGILIYVSLYEHMVHVEGDDTIAGKLSQSDFQSVCDTIISGFKSGNPELGMRKGILLCGELLATHFPIEQGDANELFDSLHLIE
ncbi:MAG: putative membrane protein [Verrucomicrobiales bacterium]|jgi:putative membrane protein